MQGREWLANQKTFMFSLYNYIGIILIPILLQSSGPAAQNIHFLLIQI